MDISNWGSPGRRCCTYLLFLAFCLLRLEVQYATASESGYASQLENQDSNDDEDTSGNKLDSLNPLLPFDLEQDSEYKRGSSFFPLRGKKLSLDEAIAAHQQLMSDQEDKRSQFFPLRGKKIPLELKRASYFMPMRGRKDEEWMSAEIPEDKRASSFMPMRGKKNIDDSDTFQHLGKAGMYSSDVTEVLYPPSSHSNQIAGKRASSFLPVRGKRSEKDPSEPLENDARDSIDTEGNETYKHVLKDHIMKKRSVSFMPKRGRRIFSQENSNAFVPEEITTSLLEKKQYSFTPMRGRKLPSPSGINNSSLDDAAAVFLADKKATSFMPMRGRRISEQSDDVQSDLLQPTTNEVFESEQDKQYPDYVNEKRALSFMPMRGRKTSLEEIPNSRNLEWIADNDALEEYKKASFTPMHGRRIDGNYENESFPTSDDATSKTDIKRLAFMPMRGRRIFEVDVGTDFSLPENEISKKSSSFLPMRGRRTSEEYITDLLDSDDKRVSSFMPMRGRRRFSDVSDSHSYYNPYPYFMAGIGSSLMSRPYRSRRIAVSSIRDLADKKRRLKINWDSVKRAFHATRGKRFNKVDDSINNLKENYFYGGQDFTSEELDNTQANHSRKKRSIIQPRVSLQPQRQYIALKRPMSFFATRGKRLDESIVDRISKLH